MEKIAKRTLSLLLVICMCMAMLPVIAPSAKAVSPNYSVSSAYKASKYYSNLLDVELTGNQREDIINVALSQVGYTEGSYYGDTGGADDGSYNNYTESNYWYNNYISSDMPIGGEWAPWCATFVSWCAEMANIPTSILKRSTAAGHGSWCFNVNFYSGSSTLDDYSDADSYFMGYNYTPKKGDLFFTRSWSHVGLVVGVSGSYVITVEGNTNDGGSAEGLGVFSRYRLISDLYFGVPNYEESYVGGSCTYYPAHCKISIDTDTPINSQPCSVSTEFNSVNLGTAKAGQTYTATALYRNSYGNYWYRVETSYGDTSYLYAGDTTYIEQITSDITLEDAYAPEAHVCGDKFTVSGTIDSPYNRLDTASCYIYEGFEPGGEAVTGYTDDVGGKQYVLDGSAIDFNVLFDNLENGNHTYEIAATYTNYYATSNTSISSNTGTIKLMREYFVVIPSSVSQSSCSHSYTTTILGGTLCTENRTQVKACSICGLVTESPMTAGGHSYESWKTITAATCTKDGSKTRTCSACGNVETQVIPATGHNYSAKIQNATCREYATYEFTCANCGDYQKMTADTLASGWIDSIPSGMDPSLFITQTQYRYSDFETKTSAESSLAGYNQTGSQWVKTGSGSIQYVPSWPSGFSASSSLYTQYNKAGSKVTTMETATAKTVVESDSQCGYLYYHWCYADSYYSQASSSGSYTTFHAYYDTTNPDNFTCDTSDMSYKTSHATCSNSNWWFVTDVYQQDYTQYQKQYTYERWTEFSPWSAAAVTASDTRKVETRTVYQLKNATLADHNYVGGTCSVCGAKDSGYVPENTDYYLFGYINGADYACEADFMNMGNYKFVDGKLTATFTETSYVAVKTEGNGAWYMTSGWQGEVNSATLYNTSVLGENANKLFVPGGVEVTFTLVNNSDGTLFLSYTAKEPDPVVKPQITLKYPTLSFEGEVFYNVYYTVSNANVNVEDMGLLTWYNRPANTASATYETAEEIIPGAVYNAGSNMYMVRSQGVPAKMLGDNMYIRVYAKLSDGTYAYSPVTYYSAKAYATDILKNSSNPDMKALVVSMLNYGAAAQVHFNHNVNTLMNADLTAAQKALAKNYSADMISTVVTPSAAKTVNFKSNGGFSNGYPSVSFDGAFSINYYLTPKKAVESGITLYCWDLATYNSVSALTEANATAKVTMAPATNPAEYFANYTGIAAKQIDETVFVAGVYTSGGVRYSSPVLCYSLSAYCADQITKGSATMQDFAKATVVYGDAAKTYFANIGN